jgi:hypothetical protein
MTLGRWDLGEDDLYDETTDESDQKGGSEDASRSETGETVGERLLNGSWREGLSDDEKLVWLDDVAGSGVALAPFASELAVALRERIAARELAARVAAEPDYSSLSLYEKLDAGLISRADAEATVAAQQKAADAAYTRTRLANMRTKLLEAGHDARYIAAALEREEGLMAAAAAERAASSPLDLDDGYAQHVQAGIDYAVAEATAIDMQLARGVDVALEDARAGIAATLAEAARPSDAS